MRVLTARRANKRRHLIRLLLRYPQTADMEPVIAPVTADHKAAFVLRLQTVTQAVAFGLFHCLQQFAFLGV